MYKLKQQPEDFIVKEISNVKIEKQGPFLYFQLKKKNWNTLDAIKKIAQVLNVKEKQIGFAGSKDKNAVTQQICSIKGINKEKLAKIKIKDLQITFLGYGNEPISLGALRGNHFEIVVRNLDQFTINKISLISNYFDEQRFSVHNVEIGRHLIKKEFSEAVKLIDNPNCKQHLEKHPHDFVVALKKLPLRLLRIYVHAYQSYLWNKTLAQYLTEKGTNFKEISYSLGNFVFVSNPEPLINLKIPLIGFASEELEHQEIKKIISTIMKTENLHYLDFVIKQIPELSLEGETRLAFVEVKDLQIEKPELDELNPNRKKIKLTFSLPKGSYATMAVRQIISLSQ